MGTEEENPAFLYARYQNMLHGLLPPGTGFLLNGETFGQFAMTLDDRQKAVLEMFLKLLKELEGARVSIPGFLEKRWRPGADEKRIIAQWSWECMKRLNNYTLNLEAMLNEFREIVSALAAFLENKMKAEMH